MFVGIVVLRYQHHTTCCAVLITECHNSDKHNRSPLTSFSFVGWYGQRLTIVTTAVSPLVVEAAYFNDTIPCVTVCINCYNF